MWSAKVSHRTLRTKPKMKKPRHQRGQNSSYCKYLTSFINAACAAGAHAFYHAFSFIRYPAGTGSAR